MMFDHNPSNNGIIVDIPKGTVFFLGAAGAATWVYPNFKAPPKWDMIRIVDRPLYILAQIKWNCTTKKKFKHRASIQHDKDILYPMFIHFLITPVFIEIKLGKKRRL